MNGPGGSSMVTMTSATSAEQVSPSKYTLSSKSGEDGRVKRSGSISSGFGGPGLLDFAGGDTHDEDEEANLLKEDSSSVIRFYPEWCHCMACLRRDTPYTGSLTWKDTFKNFLLCPPQGPGARLITFLLTFSLLVVFALLLLMEAGEGHKRERNPVYPKGPIFALAVIEILGLFAGIMMKSIYLPNLLGPLLMGILIRNVEEINLFKNFIYWSFRNCAKADHYCIHQALETSGHWIKPIRQIALTMILTRAGLELSPKQLKTLKLVVPMLAFIPCLVEACACALFTYILFSVMVTTDKIPVAMCFVSGFALAAVSPAVVVPGMLGLKRRNLGVVQGVPTLLIAASSIDDVLAISLYTICMGIAVSSGSGGDKAWEYSAGIVAIFIGTLQGLIIGVFLHFIPARDNRNKAEARLMLLLLVNLVSMFGYEEYPPLAGAGSLAVLVTSFIASFGWRSQHHWKRPMKKIEHMLAITWTLCVPLLFGTIGREIVFRDLEKDKAGKIIGIIFISLTIRCLAAFTVVLVTGLPWRERLFCALAWVPKATVQAALAPLVVSKIQDLGEPERSMLEPHGKTVVTMAVFAILITAPLGSILIAFFGPRLLRVATIPERIQLDEEFPNGEGLEPEEEQEVMRHNLSQKFRNSGGGTGSSLGSGGGSFTSLNFEPNRESSPSKGEEGGVEVKLKKSASTNDLDKTKKIESKSRSFFVKFW